MDYHDELSRLRERFIADHQPNPREAHLMRTIILSILFLALLLLIGWIANIIQVLDAINDPVAALFIFKVIGIFLLLPGAILGWIGML